MKRSIALAQQAGNPSGLLGRIIAFVMSMESKDINQIALNLLDLRSNDKAMEIGFAHGKTIKKRSLKLENGLFAGIDISETMLSVATRNNQQLIDKGKVDLKLATIEKIPYPDNYFDKVLTVNTLYFWESPSKAIAELHRVMKPGARMVISFRFDLRAIQSFPGEIYTFYSEDDVSSMFGNAGFVINDCRRDITPKHSLYWQVVSKKVSSIS